MWQRRISSLYMMVAWTSLMLVPFSDIAAGTASMFSMASYALRRDDLLERYRPAVEGD